MDQCYTLRLRMQRRKMFCCKDDIAYHVCNDLNSGPQWKWWGLWLSGASSLLAAVFYSNTEFPLRQLASSVHFIGSNTCWNCLLNMDRSLKLALKGSLSHSCLAFFAYCARIFKIVPIGWQTFWVWWAFQRNTIKSGWLRKHRKGSTIVRKLFLLLRNGTHAIHLISVSAGKLGKCSGDDIETAELGYKVGISFHL